MSTVRMSDYLRRDIVNKFEDSHQKSNPKMELDATRGDAIYNRYIGPKVEAAKEAMREHLGDIIDPDAMFSKTSTLTCLVPINHTSTSHAYEDEDMTSETELNEDYRISIPLSRLATTHLRTSGKFFCFRLVIKSSTATSENAAKIPLSILPLTEYL